MDFKTMSCVYWETIELTFCLVPSFKFQISKFSKSTEVMDFIGMVTLPNPENSKRSKREDTAFDFFVLFVF